MKVNGTEVARTNAGFSYTFVYQRVRKFDPELKQWYYEGVAPTATVSAAGYPEASLDLGV